MAERPWRAGSRPRGDASARRQHAALITCIVLCIANACSLAPRATPVAPSLTAATRAPASPIAAPPSAAQSATPPPVDPTSVPSLDPVHSDAPTGTPPPVQPSGAPALTEPFPYGEFDDPTTIDNQWLPLAPGTRWVWEGVTVDQGERQPHRVAFIVTDMTKVIDGVQTLVGWDRDFAEGELVEAEIVFLAQDNNGAIWHMGQYPEEYEEGEFVDAPGWIAGVYGSLAGYWMTADPRVGKPSYSQGWGPAVGWTDRGQVIESGLRDCVPVGCFNDVIVIEEWALDDPEARQLKFYASGVGNIRVGWSGSKDQEQETLELVAFEQLTPAELEKARLEALALEERAYANLAHVYGDTEPMRRPR